MDHHLWDFGNKFVFFDEKDWNWDSPTEDDYETHDIYESWDDFYNRKYPLILMPILRWQWIRRCDEEYSSWEHVFNPEFIKEQRQTLEHYYISDIAKLITDYFGYTEPDLSYYPSDVAKIITGYFEEELGGDGILILLYSGIRFCLRRFYIIKIYVKEEDEDSVREYIKEFQLPRL